MEKIPEEIRKDCLTIGDLTKQLLQHDASDLVFFCTESDPKLLSVKNVDSYCEYEITVKQGSLWLVDVNHYDFADDIEIIVVLGGN